MVPPCGMNSTWMTPWKSKKTVIIVLCCPLCRCAFWGGWSWGKTHAEDCLFVSGSKVAIQVSSVVMTLARNYPGSALIRAKFSSQILFLKAFCSGVNMWGTILAHQCLSLRSFFTMVHTVPLERPEAVASPRMLRLLSAPINPWITWVFNLVLLVRGWLLFGLSLVVSSLEWNLFHQTRTCVLDITSFWNTCLRCVQHSKGLYPALHKNFRFTLCSCRCSGLVTLAKRSSKMPKNTAMATHLCIPEVCCRLGVARPISLTSKVTSFECEIDRITHK